MSTKQLAIRGVAISWIRMVCAITIAFIVTPILVHGLGDEAYGLWSVIMSLTIYYAIADLGIRGASVKYLSQFEATHDKDSLNKTMVTSLVANSVLALCVVVAVLIFLPFFSWCFDIGSQDVMVIRCVIFLTGVSVAITFVGQTFDAALVALKRLDVANTVTLAAQLTQAVLVVSALHFGGGLLAMAWIVILIGILNQLCRFHFAIRMMPEVTLSLRHFDWDILRTLLRFGSLNVVQGMARRAMESGGVIIVAAMLGPATATFYAIAESLVNKFAQLRTGITGPLEPIASQLDAQDRRPDLIRAFFLATRILFSIAAMSAMVLVFLGRPLIDLWMGNGYSNQTYPVLCILVTAMIPHIATFGARSVLTGMNCMRFLASISLVELAMTVIFGVVFVKNFGLNGMAIGILLAQIIAAGIVIPVYACRVLNLPIHELVVKGIGPGLFGLLPGFLLACILGHYFPPTHIAHVVLQGGVIGLLCGAGMYFLCFDREMRRVIIRSFTRFGPQFSLRAN